jgi:hypothetical protein
MDRDPDSDTDPQQCCQALENLEFFPLVSGIDRSYLVWYGLSWSAGPLTRLVSYFHSFSNLIPSPPIWAHLPTFMQWLAFVPICRSETRHYPPPPSPPPTHTLLYNTVLYNYTALFLMRSHAYVTEHMRTAHIQLSKLHSRVMNILHRSVTFSWFLIRMVCLIQIRTRYFWSSSDPNHLAA